MDRVNFTYTKIMLAKTEDQIILKLILKGQSESDIIDYLRKRDMVDRISVYRIQSKIREMKAAQAFLPHTPSFFERFSSVFFGIIITLLGIFFLLPGASTYGWIGLLGCGIVVAGGLSLVKKGIARSRWD